MKKHNPKSVGEVVEQLFTYEAMRRDFTVSRPVGDSASYDATVDPQGQDSNDPQGQNSNDPKPQDSDDPQDSGDPSELAQRPARERLVTVQIRGVMRRNGRSYKVDTRHGMRRRKLTPADADVLAVYVGPERTWYLIPVSEFAPANHLSLYPHVKNSQGKWERWREKWSLLREFHNPNSSSLNPTA